MESIDLPTENPLDGSFLNISLEETVHTTKYDSYQCDICQKKFKSQQNLKRHLKIHDGTKLFCPSCTQYFDSEEKLNKHKIDKHSYNLLCSFCGKTFNKRQNMNEHIKAHEINNNNGKDAAGSQVHVCPFEQCRNKFFRLSKYQDHLNTHTRIEPYECQHCHKKFTGRYRRNEHEKVCNGSVKLICCQCQTTFTDRQALQRHTEAQHLKKKIICPCGKVYKYYSSLFKHKKKLKH